MTRSNLYEEEIIIESYPGYFSHVKFDDKLKISSNCIFYKKHFFNDHLFESEDELEEVKWEYKTTSKEFSDLFDALCKASVFYEKYDRGMALDAGGYKITIKMVDNSKKELRFDDCDFEVEDESLQYIFYLIRKMIPQTEELPFYLSHQTLESIQMKLREIDEIITELEKRPKLDASKGYPTWVWTMLCGILEIDFDYATSFDKLVKQKTDFSKLTFEEIKTFVTGLARAERWSEGSIIHFVENGFLLQAMKRLRELLENEEE